MIINHAQRFVFIHIPKTAGTTLTEWLSKATTYKDLELGGSPFGQKLQQTYGERFGLRKHSPAAEVRRVMGEEDWNAYFRFGFVRNPFMRLASAYHFLKSRKTLNEAWVKHLAETPDYRSFLDSDLWQRKDSPDKMLQPQHTWLCDPQDPTRLMVDFVGKVERMTPDIEKLRKQLPGLPRAPHASVRLNATPKYSAPLDLPNDVVDRIASYYAHDFRVFEYRIDPQFTYLA